MPLIEDYAPIVGQDVIDDLRLLSERLRGKTVKNVNSTAVGGGVAEILNRMIPLLRQMEIDASWDVICRKHKRSYRQFPLPFFPSGGALF